MSKKGLLINMKYFWGGLLLLLILATYFLTLRHLPPGLLNDEADIGFEAYSISVSGGDQWGNFLPLQYFSGFGGTRLPLLVYWTVPFVKVLGLSPESVRLAGVAASLFAALGFFLLLKKLYQNPVFAGLGTLALVVNPWYWGLTRTTNEAVIALALTFWPIWLLFKSQEKNLHLLTSAVLFGLSTYAYYTNQVFVPLIITALVLGLPWLRQFNTRIKIAAVILLLIIASPLILKTFAGGGSATRFSQTGLFSNISLVGQVNDHRGICIENAPELWCRALYNKPAMWLGQFSTNYLNHYSLNFLFSENWFVGILPPGRLFYLSLLPGLLFGLYFLVTKEKSDNKWLWISWLIAAPVADSLTSSGHAMRALLLVPPIIAISLLGWQYIFRLIKKSKRLMMPLIICALIFFALELAHFMSDYWWYFPKRNSMYTHYQYQPLFKNLLTLENSHPSIYISNDSGSVKQYAFYVFYKPYNPEKFQTGQEVEWVREPEGWIWVKRIGKWNFVKSLPELNQVPEGSLFAGSPEEIQKISKPRRINVQGDTIFLLKKMQSIKYKSGDTAFIIGVMKRFPRETVCNENTSSDIFETVCK